MIIENIFIGIDGNEFANVIIGVHDWIFRSIGVQPVEHRRVSLAGDIRIGECDLRFHDGGDVPYGNSGYSQSKACKNFFSIAGLFHPRIQQENAEKEERKNRYEPVMAWKLKILSGDNVLIDHNNGGRNRSDKNEVRTIKRNKIFSYCVIRACQKNQRDENGRKPRREVRIYESVTEKCFQIMRRYRRLKLKPPIRQRDKKPDAEYLQKRNRKNPVTEKEREYEENEENYRRGPIVRIKLKLQA